VFANHKNQEAYLAILVPGIRSCLLACAVLLSLGCKTKVLTDPIIGPDHTVRNVFRKGAVLPATLRRVAVLPLSYDENNPSVVAGQQVLLPVLQSELIKAARFELVVVKPLQLQQWTGRDRWDSFEELPPNLLKELVQKTGSDAVLFVHLSRFSAYPPIVIGWRMKLVSNEADILWAVDELFDASEEAVSNSARRYDRAHVRNNPVLEDSRSILLSPSRFGQYVTHAVLQTLPGR
jgi:hypothetical protein